MALTAEQRLDAYQLGAGMFQASLGTFYLDFLTNEFESGKTKLLIYQEAEETSLFQNLEFGYDNGDLNTAFANAFANNLLGPSTSNANKQIAVNWMLDKLNPPGAVESRGQVIMDSIETLWNIPSSDPNFGDASARLHNQVTVSMFYTEVQGGSSANINVLQETLVGVDETDASVTDAQQNFVFDQTFVLIEDRLDAPGITEIPGTTGINTQGGPGQDIYLAAAETGWEDFDIVRGAGGIDTFRAFMAGNERDLQSQQVELLAVSSSDDTFNDVDMQLATGFTDVKFQNSDDSDLDLFDIQNPVDIAAVDVEWEGDYFPAFGVYFDDDVLGSDEAELNLVVQDATMTLELGTEGNDVITGVNITDLAESYVSFSDDGSSGLAIQILTIDGDGLIAIAADQFNRGSGQELENTTRIDASAHTGGVLVDLAGSTFFDDFGIISSTNAGGENQEDVEIDGSSETDLILFGRGGLGGDDIDLGEGEFDTVVAYLDDITQNAAAALLGVEILALYGDISDVANAANLSPTFLDLGELNNADLLADLGNVLDEITLINTEGTDLNFENADGFEIHLMNSNGELFFDSTGEVIIDVGPTEVADFAAFGEDLPFFTFPNALSNIAGDNTELDKLDLDDGTNSGVEHVFFEVRGTGADLEIFEFIVHEDFESLTASGSGDLRIDDTEGDDNGSMRQTYDLSGLTGAWSNHDSNDAGGGFNGPGGRQVFLIGEIDNMAVSGPGGDADPGATYDMVFGGGEDAGDPDVGATDVTSLSIINLGSPFDLPTDGYNPGNGLDNGSDFDGTGFDAHDAAPDVVRFTMDFDANVAIEFFADSDDDNALTDDLLDFSAYGIQFDELIIKQTTDGTLITTDSGAFSGAILLVGVDAAFFTDDDFSQTL